MTTKVHILATVRKPDLLPAATLVFQTLRVGFPTAEIVVWCNSAGFFPPIQFAAATAGVKAFVQQETTHHEWICKLFEHETEPFFILDTDIVFWENFERFDFSGASMAGRYIPQFKCDFANAITRPRLHTCLLYIDPRRVLSEWLRYRSLFPSAYCTPRPTIQDLIYPRYIPHKTGVLQRNYFSDTTSLLYHAIGGQPFTEEQNLAFDHLQSGTLSDLVGEKYAGGNIVEFHAACLDQPHLLKGQWKRDLENYRSRYAE